LRFLIVLLQARKELPRHEKSIQGPVVSGADRRIARKRKALMLTRNRLSAGLPPLIDRELIFGNPEISGAQLSPDGKYLAFQKPWKRHAQHLRQRCGRTLQRRAIAHRRTQAPDPRLSLEPRQQTHSLRKDNDGDENYNVYAVDPAAKPAAGRGMLPLRATSPGLKGIRVQLVDVPKERS